MKISAYPSLLESKKAIPLPVLSMMYCLVRSPPLIFVAVNPADCATSTNATSLVVIAFDAGSIRDPTAVRKVLREKQNINSPNPRLRHRLGLERTWITQSLSNRPFDGTPV